MKTTTCRRCRYNYAPEDEDLCLECEARMQAYKEDNNFERVITYAIAAILCFFLWALWGWTVDFLDAISNALQRSE